MMTASIQHASQPFVPTSAVRFPNAPLGRERLSSHARVAMGEPYRREEPFELEELIV